ncbi:unnamed protein product [Scytosiphon promiscuus]
MQFLRKACGSIPVSMSALALSSTRRFSPLATYSCRASSASRGWTAAGVPRGGGVFGASGKLFAGLHTHGREVPLVQVIYDELATMKDPEGEAKKGVDSPVIAKVMRLMDTMEPRDLGMSEGDFQGLPHSLCMPIFVDDEACFEMTVFVLPRGGEIPLHDHPNMAVMSRILFGSLEVDAYDMEPQQQQQEGQDLQPDQVAELEEVAAVDDVARGAVDAEGGTFRSARRERPHGAEMGAFGEQQQRRTVTASTRSFLLTPSEGNVHAFRAPAACAVFDVLIPPYDNTRGRKCSYFRVEPPAAARSGATSPGREVGAAAPAASSGAGRGGEDDPKADDGTATTERKRVILREVPEPQGLPRWSRYYGPPVNPR